MPDFSTLPQPIDTNRIHELTKIANTLRTLSIDAIQKADSGHPGLPLGCAEIAAYLYGHLLRHNPENPQMINRDRFYLSAGHGSMLLYSALYVSGFGLTLDDLKNFRQFGSKTPGHPESFMTKGVETTSGPLGQGFGNAVGAALGIKMAAARFNTDEFPLFTSKVYVLAGDGCIMEGVCAEASSLAGHLDLNNLVVFYDANQITLDGPLHDSCSEDTKQRYRAYNWDVYEIDGNNFEQIDKAVRQAIYNQKKPVLIIAKTIIGKGAPSVEGTNKAHGTPLSIDDIRLVKELLGTSLDPFQVPPSVLQFFKEKRISDAKEEVLWSTMFENYSRKFPEKRAEFDQMYMGSLPENLEALLTSIPIKSPTSGRKASWEVLNTLASHIPQLITGSADLSISDLTFLKNTSIVSKDHMEGKTIKFGDREFAMATCAIGLTQTHLFLPIIGTFLTFSDYMRNSIRLSAMMHSKIIFQFTHDSIFLGEDGPTHQPIEHIASLRIIPNLQVIRPSGTHETKMAFLAALDYNGPTALILSRQNIIDVPGTFLPYAQGVARGAYIVRHEKKNADFTLIATGSELPLAIDVANALEQIGKSVRVVSMPCSFLFDQQPSSYKETILGSHSGKKVSIEAAALGVWPKYIGHDGIGISIDSFGASGPAQILAEQFGFTVEHILDRLLS